MQRGDEGRKRCRRTGPVRSLSASPVGEDLPVDHYHHDDGGRVGERVLDRPALVCDESATQSKSSLIAITERKGIRDAFKMTEIRGR